MDTTYSIGSVAEVISGKKSPKKTPMKLQEIKVEKTVTDDATPKKNRRRSKAANLGTPMANTSIEQNTPKQPGSIKKEKINESGETVPEEATPKKNRRRSRSAGLGTPMAVTNIEQNTPKQLGSLKKEKIKENGETVTDETTPKKNRRHSRGTPKTDTSVKQNTPEQPDSLKKKKRKSTDSAAATPEVLPKKTKSLTATEVKVWKPDEEAEKRSIFVGNVPKDVNMGKLKSLFSKYGEVESCRVRGITPADPNISKRIAAITKQTNSNRDSVQCYVVFKDEADVSKALAVNGQEFAGHHLCVDLAKKQPHNPERAVFIGNLPFKAEEEAIWKAFQDCGKIASVRVVRDKLTGIGKGFGYVNFESADGVELALQMEGIVIKDRTLRLQRCVSSVNKKGRRRTFPFANSKKTPRSMKKGPVAQAAGDQPPKAKADTAPFQGAKFTDKKKRTRPNKDLLRKKKLSKVLALRKKVQ